MKQAGWQNLKKDIKTYYKGVLTAGICIILMDILFGHMCPMVLLTGLPCPACGLTRAGLYVMTFQLNKAWQMNPVIYPIALFLLYFIICRYLLGRPVWGWQGMLWSILVILLMVYMYRMASGFTIETESANYNPSLSTVVYHWDNALNLLYRMIKHIYKICNK